MRRDGTTINNTNPSHLILSVGISTLGNTGDRFSDFELYRSRIAYNQSTGVFSNSGPAATGGHSEWEFNPNGSIREIGDLTLTFAFNTGGVQEIAIYKW
ncbi:MAG: hypothetical protein LH619_06645, partial [Chitinophagaceae bacterium]|nr:hypothetical protein [Chitinophagaceae bacterium]